MKLTLSVSSTTLYSGSRNTFRFNAPPNSHSIRATSSATRRRPFPAALIMLWANPLTECGWTKLSWRTDKRGEVVGRMVERAIGIQGRPPPIQRTPRSTSWRFGNLEKLKDRSKFSCSSTPGGSISANSSDAGNNLEGVILTMERSHVRQLHEGLAACLCEPHSWEETLARTANLYIGEM